MNQYHRDIIDVNPQRHGITEEDVNRFMRGVFGWMFLGLLLSAVSSVGFLVALVGSPAIQANLGVIMMIFAFSTIGLVFVLSMAINKLSVGAARLMFVVYAILTGMSLSSIFLVYDMGLIALAFAMAAVFFGIMAIFGYNTQTDLSSAGRIFFAGLIAVLIAMIINFFLNSPMIEYFISIGGIAVFAGLTAYEVQRLKNDFYYYAAEGGPELVQKVSILGALSLYLKLINLFLFILRFLGMRGRD